MGVIAIDSGTTGVTAVLYGEDLRVVAKAYRELPQHFPRPGWVEHDVDELRAALDAVLGELAGHGAARASALGITNQRETVFALERATGRALARGIVWQDRRTTERCRALAASPDAAWLAERSGLLVDPYFSSTKVEWLLGHVDGLARRAARGEVVFATVDAVVAHHLRGGREWTTDPTNASRTQLYSIDDRAWDERACALFGVDPAWLCEVRPSAGDFGEMDARFVGKSIPIRGIAGDQQSALFGQRCWRAGESKATYGTGLFVLVNAGDERPAARRGLLTTLAADGAGRAVYALEGSAFQGGSTVQWLRDQLGLFAKAADSAALAASVPDSGGVTLVPAFTGLGAPYWAPDARGALLGLTRGTTKAHIARAALESIAFQVAELLDLFRESGVPIERLRVDGGAAANDVLMQLQADLAGLAVERPTDLEATARGAALLAGLGANLWPSAEALPAPDLETFEPKTTADERTSRLEHWRAAVQRVL